MRAREGPTKNLLQERQRNAQQDTKTQWSLQVFRCPGAKANIKLGRFSRAFAEITAEMSLEAGFHYSGICFPKNNLHPVTGKSSRFSDFFGLFITLRKKKDAFASPLRWGRLCRLGKLAHARYFSLSRDANGRVFLRTQSALTEWIKGFTSPFLPPTNKRNPGTS